MNREPRPTFQQSQFQLFGEQAFATCGQQSAIRNLIACRGKTKDWESGLAIASMNPRKLGLYMKGLSHGER
jgi:hypothetical protein